MKLTHNYLIRPSSFIEVGKLAKDEGISPEETERITSGTGITRLRMAETQSASRLVMMGLEKCRELDPGPLQSVDAVIVVSQTLDNRLPSLSTQIQATLELSPSTYCIDVIDGCAGYVKAISLISSLSNQGYRRILLVTGDINSKMTKNSSFGTKILFGDGFSIGIFTASNKSMNLVLRNNGDLDEFLHCAVDQSIVMNGFEILRFTRREVPPLVQSFLKDNKLAFSDFQLIGYHQASKLVVDSLSGILGAKNKKADDFLLGDTGNIGSGSIGGWLALVDGLTVAGELRMMALGFGAGLSIGVADFFLDLERNVVIDVES